MVLVAVGEYSYIEDRPLQRRRTVLGLIHQYLLIVLDQYANVFDPGYNLIHRISG
jgi:hypothetical protein